MPIKKLHNATMIAMNTETGETFEISGEPVELDITTEIEGPLQKSMTLTNEISGELKLSPASKKLLLRCLFGGLTNNDLKRHHIPKRRRYGRGNNLIF